MSGSGEVDPRPARDGDDEALGRLRTLRDALVDLSRTSSLECLAGDGDSGMECTLRLYSPEGAVARLTLSPGGVTVTTRSEDDHPEAGDGVIQDRLGVHLEDGYAWDDATCASASELARLLVKHMRRRLAQADPDPADADVEGDDAGG